MVAVVAVLMVGVTGVAVSSGWKSMESSCCAYIEGDKAKRKASGLTVFAACVCVRFLGKLRRTWQVTPPEGGEEQRWRRALSSLGL